MKYNFKKIIVVALGGSIIFPDLIDVGFLKKFSIFIKRHIKKNKKFILVAGGGRISRIYQQAASKIIKLNNEDKDWLGIHATRCNAHLLRTIFREIAYPIVIDEKDKIKKITHPITIASGWKPGWSTDYISVALAVEYGVSEVIIAGKPSYVYDKDPHTKSGKKVIDAKPLRELTWSHYRRMIPKKWIPGFHSPVDPIAAKLAQDKKIKAIIINGKNLKNFDNLLQGKNFQGTIISE
jgi:uridylate kinase